MSRNYECGIVLFIEIKYAAGKICCDRILIGSLYWLWHITTSDIQYYSYTLFFQIEGVLSKINLSNRSKKYLVWKVR